MSGQNNYFGKDSITPSFPGTKSPINPADKTLSENRKSTSSSAKSSLKDLETSAELYHNNSSDARSSEHASLYTGSGRKSNKKEKSRFRRFAPSMTIIGVVLAGFLGISSLSSLLGPHVQTLFTQATDTQYYANLSRSETIYEEILSGEMSMSSRMQTRFAKYNIDTSDQTNWKFNGQNITANNFRETYANDAAFREAYTDANQSRASNFFDDAADQIYRKLGLSRDVFNNYQSTGNDDVDEASYKQLMTEYFDGETNTNINTAEDRPILDDEGNETGEYERVATGEDVTAGEKSNIADNYEVSAEAKQKARSYLNSVGSKVAATEAGCAALQVGNMIAVAIAANERYNSIHDFMVKTENISKSQYGEGDASGINSLLNWFTKTETVTINDPETDEAVTLTGSPLEGEGERLVLGGLTPDQNKLRYYSTERGFISTLAAISTAGLTIATCSTARAAGALISLSTLFLPGGSFIRTSIGLLLQVPLAVGAQVAAGALLGFLIPTIARVMFTNPFQVNNGIPGGEAYARGAAAANAKVAQSTSGQMPASEDKILSYNQKTSVALAQEAEVDRLHRSPFDASSPNTFIGSLISSSYPLLASLSSDFSAIHTLTSLTNTSLASLSSTYAAGIDSSYITTFGRTCQLSEEIGGRSDIYCDSIHITDPDIINLSSFDETYQEVISKSLTTDENGRETIIDNSPLANFIVYGAERDSPFGVRDANIANACELSLGIVGNSLPILSEVVDIVNALKSDYCADIADGSRYIASADNPYWETEKYHQLYVLQTRSLDKMGYYDEAGVENPVTAFKEKYYTEHPLDNSRSGYLARISGLTKDDAEVVLAIADCYKELGTYDYSTAYIFTESSPTDESDKSDLIHDCSSYDYLPSKFLMQSIRNFDNTRRHEETTA